MPLNTVAMDMFILEKNSLDNRIEIINSILAIDLDAALADLPEASLGEDGVIFDISRVQVRVGTTEVELGSFVVKVECKRVGFDSTLLKGSHEERVFVEIRKRGISESH